MQRWLKARWSTLLGRVGLRVHHTEFALKNFRKSSEHEPNNLRTVIEIGWCLHNLKNYAAAIEAYERAIRQRPDYASARACLGLSLAEAQRLQEAIDELRRAVRIQPKSKHRWYWDFKLGALLAHTGRWEEAIQPLRQSIEIKPREASTRYWLGKTYAQGQHHAEAVGQFREALRLCPNEPDSLREMGVSLSALGRFDEAADAYKQAIQFRPEYNQDVRIWANLGHAYSNCQKRELAVRAYENALKAARNLIQLNTDDADAHCFAGVALSGLEQHEAAILEYQKAVQLQPAYFEALGNLGHAYLDLNRNQEAIAPLEHAVKLRPECVEAHDLLGVAYLKSDSHELALEQLRIVDSCDSTFDSSLRKLIAEEKSTANEKKT